MAMRKEALAMKARILALIDRPYRSVKQLINRLKNLRNYKYIKCPQCHSLIRLPRRVGKVTVTCGRCRHSFKQWA